MNLKQLFLTIQCLLRVSGKIELEEICHTESKEDNPYTRELYLLRDGTRIKELTFMGISAQDIAIRDQAQIVENNWHKD